MFLPASIPSPDVSFVEFSLFGFDFRIHFYALFILLGIVLAVLITNRRLTRRGGEPWVVADILLFAVPLGIIGARIYHVLTHPNDYFHEGADLLKVLYIWEGGIAIFGALLGGSIGALIGCKISGIKFFSFVDALAPGLLLAQAVGRFGNYFNQELFGQPTTLPWGLEIARPNSAIPSGVPVDTLFHPTFLYEMTWNVLGAVLLVFFLERRFHMRWGRAFAFYLIWYGIGRSIFESIRIDPSEIFLGLRVNVWTAVIAVVLGVVLLLVLRRRFPGREISVYRDGKNYEERKMEHEERKAALQSNP